MEVADNITRNLPKNILDLFWKLSNKNSSVRISASLSIMRFLHEKQRLVDQNDELTVHMKYCLERLIKGLSSSRDAARLGFALLLTEVMKQISTIEIEDALELVKQHLAVIPKQEKRDLVFGQLFVYSSIVRSGRLVDHSHLSFVTLAIYDLWQNRTYILNACYEVLKDLFSQLSSEKFKESLWPHLKEKFSSGWEECVPENLWLLLMSVRMFPEAVNEKFFKKCWNSSNILSAENFDYLKKLVRQTTSSVPKLHPLSSEIAIICSSGKKTKELWHKVVDENLFESDHMEKAFVGFEMLKSALQSTANKKLVKSLLAPKFSAVFVRSYLNMKSPLNPAASQLADYLSTFAIKSNDPNIQLLILKFFLQVPNISLLDQALKKKAVSLLIQNLLPEAVKLYFEFLKNAVTNKKSNSDETVNLVSTKKCIFIAQIGALVFHPNVTTDIEWRIYVMKYLLLNSFFSLKKTTAEILHCEGEIGELPDNIRTAFADAFFKSLTSLHQRIESMTPLQNAIQCILLLIEYADQLMAADEIISPLFPIEKVVESWQQTKKIVHKLKKHRKKGLNGNESNAFLALFLELGFYLLHEFEQIADLLEELHICCKKALHNFKHCKEEEEVDKTEPSWICVVTDIMLSLLSRPSNHLRRLVTSVFQLLCQYINQDALEQILSVINPGKSEDQSVLVEESDTELKFEMSDVDESFNQNLRNALGSAAEVTDDESIVLSDSDMFKLDGALSKAFREQKQTGPNQMKSEDKSLLHFRTRTFDLLLIYLKSDPPMCLVLQCIEPVLAAFVYGHQNEQQKTLIYKSSSVLEAITKIKKFKHLENVEKFDLEILLEMLVARCHKEVNLSIAKKLYALSVFIVLCYRHLESHDSSEKISKKHPFYLKVYLSALEVFAIGSSSNMFPQFFVSLIESCPDLAWDLIEKCMGFAFNNEVRMYRKTQCLGLLLESIKFAKGQASIKDDQWCELGNTLMPKAIETLKVIIEDPEGKPSYLRELLDVIFTSHSVIKEKTNQFILQQYSELVQLLSNLPKLYEKRLPKKGRSMRNKIIQSLGGCVKHKKFSNSVSTVLTEEAKTEHSGDGDENTSIVSLHKKRKSDFENKKKSKKIKDNEIVENSF